MAVSFLIFNCDWSFQYFYIFILRDKINLKKMIIKCCKKTGKNRLGKSTWYKLIKCTGQHFDIYMHLYNVKTPTYRRIVIMINANVWLVDFVSIKNNFSDFETSLITGKRFKFRSTFDAYDNCEGIFRLQHLCAEDIHFLRSSATHLCPRADDGRWGWENLFKDKNL